MRPMTVTTTTNDFNQLGRDFDSADQGVIASVIDRLASLLKISDREIAENTNGRLKRSTVAAKRGGRLALQFEDLFLLSEALGVPAQVLLLPLRDAIIETARAHPKLNPATTDDTRATLTASNADVVQWLSIQPAHIREWLTPPADLPLFAPAVVLEAAGL